MDRQDGVKATMTGDHLIAPRNGLKRLIQAAEQARSEQVDHGRMHASKFR